MGVGSSFWNTAAPYIAAIVAAVALLAAAWISHSIKISEFRQAWINDLRKDIADYIGASDLWMRNYDEINFKPSDIKDAVERNVLFPTGNTARTILWRIKMRFNPRKNEFGTEDDRFLQSLENLLNPGARAPRGGNPTWSQLASDAVDQASEILKREWEVTKRFPLFSSVSQPRKGDETGRALSIRGIIFNFFTVIFLAITAYLLFGDRSSVSVAPAVIALLAAIFCGIISVSKE